MIIKDWIIPIFSGCAMPIIATLIGARVVRRQTEKDSEKKDETQREKILTLLKKEAELFIKHRIETGTYRARSFSTANIVIKNPLFNVKDHEKLIELVLDILRIHDNLDVAVRLSNDLIAGTFSNLTKPDLIRAAAHQIEKILGVKPTVEKVLSSLQDHVNKMIDDTAKQAEPIIIELITEINRLLCINEDATIQILKSQLEAASANSGD